MKKIILILFLFNRSFLFSQEVFEYNNEFNVTFKVYSDLNNRLSKLIKESDFSLRTPEKVAQAYFFAFDSLWFRKLYLDKKDVLKRNESHYKNIAKTKSKDIYIKLLHRMDYEIQGKKRCYIMFIVRIKDISFPFPTLLSLININNEWLIDSRANQYSLRKCLMLFKPCVLSSLIERKSSNKIIKELIDKTNTTNNYLDFIKLFDELVKITNDDKLSEELTLAKDDKCNIDYKKEVKARVNFTGVFEKIDVKKYDKDEQGDNRNLISLVKKNNDSIFLNEKMDITYNDKVFSVLKYDTFNKDVKKSLSSRIDRNNIKDYKPVKDLIFLYENLDTKIFNDLTPSIDKEKNKRQEKEVLYRKTRGVYNILNITKLYELFLEDKSLFDNYMYK